MHLNNILAAYGLFSQLVYAQKATEKLHHESFPYSRRDDATNAPTPISTQATATDTAGSTVVGVYNLVTLDQYKFLKEKETVTISQTTTGSDGQPTVAAGAAIVAAGGVAWLLGSGSNPAVFQPKEPPENGEEKSSCPAQRHKCDECGAAPGINVCVIPDAGCGCEPERQCNNDQQAQCSAEQNCKTKDGKCTLGDHAGCDCKQSPCPEEAYTPYCEFCGNKDIDGKCNGIADKNNLWKGCKCHDYVKTEAHLPEYDQSDDFNPDTLPKINSTSYSYGGDNPLKCLDLGLDAKKDDLKKSIVEWCKDANGTKVTKSDDENFAWKRFNQSYYSYWLAAGYDGASGKCDDSAEVNELNCASTMLKQLHDCNAGQDTFQGGELTDGCVRYYVTFSRSTKDNDPPFKPLPQNSPECAKGDKDISDIAFNFWQGVSKKFCNDVGDGKSGKKADLKNTDLQTRSIMRRTPPPSKSSYADWKFHFEWEPKDSGSCSKTCGEAMKSFADGCGHYGGQQNSMTYKGSINVGCGQYSYSLEGPPKQNPAKYGPPHVSCDRYYYGAFFTFELTLVKWGSTEDEKKLKKEVSGCGAVTNWSFQGFHEPKAGDHTNPLGTAKFQLPIIMAANCVERAIRSAGAPFPTDETCAKAQYWAPG